MAEEMDADEFNEETDGEEILEDEYTDGPTEDTEGAEESADTGSYGQGPEDLGPGGGANIDLMQMFSQGVAIGLPPGEQAEMTKKFRMWGEPIARMFDLDEAFAQQSQKIETHLSPGKKLGIGIGFLTVIAVALRKGGNLSAPNVPGGNQSTPPKNPESGESAEEDVPDWMKEDNEE